MTFHGDGAHSREAVLFSFQGPIATYKRASIIGRTELLVSNYPKYQKQGYNYPLPSKMRINQLLH